MANISLFPFAEYWWAYAGFTIFVLALLALDLGVFHRGSHEISFRDAAFWSVAWTLLALLFNVALYQYALWKFPQDPRLMAIPGFVPEAAARQVGLEFLAGYLIERSLAVDNVFIFVLVFAYFSIPPALQHKVLFYGILGALLFRAGFIAAGAVLMQYHWVVWLFGAFLVFTGINMIYSPETKIEPERNPLIRLFRRLMPLTPHLHGDRFFVRLDGLRHATPLFIALLFLELTDVVFAFDSVPAIFAVTGEPLLVFTSNIFAILGLRAMYFILAGAMDKFHLLKYGLAVILIFVGLKMVWLNDWFGGKFPISLSLGIIGLILAVSIGLSLLRPKREIRDKAPLPAPSAGD